MTESSAPINASLTKDTVGNTTEMEANSVNPLFTDLNEELERINKDLQDIDNIISTKANNLFSYDIDVEKVVSEDRRVDCLMEDMLNKTAKIQRVVNSIKLAVITF